MTDHELLEIYKYICPRCKYPLMRQTGNTFDEVECVNDTCDYGVTYDETKFKGIPQVKDK